MIGQWEDQEFLEYITTLNSEELLGFELILKAVIANPKLMKQQREKAKQFLKMVQNESDLRKRTIQHQSEYLH